MAFHPYLYFGGNCREAFTRYQEIFGGELFVMSMKDVPDQPIPAGKENYVLHAALDDRRRSADGFGRPDHRQLRPR